LLLEKILNNIDLMGPVEEGGPHHHLPPPERLEWKVRPELEQRFQQAANVVDK
jgi:choline O-acetyltransferase